MDWLRGRNGRDKPMDRSTVIAARVRACACACVDEG